MRPVLTERSYRGRRAVSVENEDVRVTVLAQGGHIAEVFDKRTRMNPLWTPPWESIEPSMFDPMIHGSTFGTASDAKLLAGIMGHNVCLDIFGDPSSEEAAAGLTAHGEAAVAEYDLAEAGNGLVMRVALRLAQIAFERRIDLRARTIRVHERVESLAAFDRPVGWTEHVTLGPPFLEKGRTQFSCSATESRVFESSFGEADYLRAGATFDWPFAPGSAGGLADLRVFTTAPESSAYTAHLMTGAEPSAFFVAFSPISRLAFGYVWRSADFPWMGIWEENRSRMAPPWKGETLARGMEFGVSPFPEIRRAMVNRGRLFDVPTFRWLSARGVLETTYCILLQSAETIPQALEWPQEEGPS